MNILGGAGKDTVVEAETKLVPEAEKAGEQLIDHAVEKLKELLSSMRITFDPPKP